MEAMLANLTFGMNVRDEAFKAALSSDREALRQKERQFKQSGYGMGAAMQAAVARGKAEANWIAAATLDRYLMKIGQPQIYGTQYTRSKERGATMDPYDRALIPDSLRKALGVPVQTEQDKKLEAMKTAVPKP